MNKKSQHKLGRRSPAWIAVTMAVLAAGLAGQGHAANIVTDPGFEGQSAAWQFTGGSFFDNFDPAHGGTVTAVLSSCCGSFSGTISQDLVTIPGEIYMVALWLATNSNFSGGVSVFFDGTPIFSQFMGGETPFFPVGGLATASGAVSTLSVISPSFVGTLFVDDAFVEVEPQAPGVPEPGTWRLMALGMLATLRLAHRRLA